MLHAEIGSVVLHMCAFGMVAEDETGKATVKKGTRLLSSSGELIKRVDRRCSNEVRQAPHRHVHLIQGRAKAAQVYHRDLAVSICEGIAAQKRIKALGITPRDQSMRQAAKAGMDECPANARHRMRGHGSI